MIVDRAALKTTQLAPVWRGVSVPQLPGAPRGKFYHQPKASSLPMPAAMAAAQLSRLGSAGNITVWVATFLAHRATAVARLCPLCKRFQPTA